MCRWKQQVGCRFPVSSCNFGPMAGSVLKYSHVHIPMVHSHVHACRHDFCLCVRTQYTGSVPRCEADRLIADVLPANLPTGAAAADHICGKERERHSLEQKIGRYGVVD